MIKVTLNILSSTINLEVLADSIKINKNKFCLRCGYLLAALHLCKFDWILKEGLKLIFYYQTNAMLIGLRFYCKSLDEDNLEILEHIAHITLLITVYFFCMSIEHHVPRQLRL